jgi:phage terminase large subunit-like protein
MQRPDDRVIPGLDPWTGKGHAEICGIVKAGQQRVKPAMTAASEEQQQF